jgi:type VI protein secretion system component VasK
MRDLFDRFVGSPLVAIAIALPLAASGVAYAILAQRWWVDVLVALGVLALVIVVAIGVEWWRRPRPAPDPALQELHARWRDFFDRFVKSGKERAIERLPWFIVVGNSGSGKTTALRNSGVQFDLTIPDRATDRGGRTFDWLLSGKAILLDVGGSLIADETEPGHAIWVALLELLRDHPSYAPWIGPHIRETLALRRLRQGRSRIPLNGLVITVGVDDLLLKDSEEIVAEANRLRARIDELIRALEVQLPIYLVLTKCDLIQGFVDSFGRLPDSRLAQGFGWTNPSPKVDDVRQMLEEPLEHQREEARKLRTAVLRDAQDPRILRNIYLFPEELRTVKAGIKQYCDAMFRPKQPNEPISLRGVYLTSALQTGATIAKLLDSLGFHPEPVSASVVGQRSYFLRGLLQDRLDADKGTASRRTKHPMLIKQNLGRSGIIALCVLAACWAYVSFKGNRGLVIRARESIEALQRFDRQQGKERIEILTQYLNEIDDVQGRRLKLNERFGLYTGARLEEILGERLKQFLPLVNLTVVQQWLELDVSKGIQANQFGVPATPGALGVSGAFTPTGLQRLQALLDRTTQLGSPPGATGNLRQEYGTRYFDEWQGFLTSLTETDSYNAENCNPYVSALSEAYDAVKAPVLGVDPPEWVHTLGRVVEAKDAYWTTIKPVCARLVDQHAGPCSALPAGSQTPGGASVLSVDDLNNEVKRLMNGVPDPNDPVADHLMRLLLVPINRWGRQNRGTCEEHLWNQFSVAAAGLKARPPFEPDMVKEKFGSAGAVRRYCESELAAFGLLSCDTMTPKAGAPWPAPSGIVDFLKKSKKISRVLFDDSGAWRKYTAEIASLGGVCLGNCDLTETSLEVDCPQGHWRLLDRGEHRTDSLRDYQPDLCVGTRLQVKITPHEGPERMLPVEIHGPLALLQLLATGKRLGQDRVQLPVRENGKLQANVIFQITPPTLLDYLDTGGIPSAPTPPSP